MSNFRSHRAYYDSLKDDSDNEQRRSPGNSNRRWQHDRFQHGPARPPPELIDLDADDDVEDERTRRRRVEADEPVVAASGPNEDVCEDYRMCIMRRRALDFVLCIQVDLSGRV